MTDPINAYTYMIIINRCTEPFPVFKWHSHWPTGMPGGPDAVLPNINIIFHYPSDGF